jgi:hypothetical protein
MARNWAHLVQLGTERIVTTRRPADKSPIIDGKLMTAGRSLAFRHDLKRANKFHGRLESQRQGFVRLGLPSSRSAIHDKKTDKVSHSGTRQYGLEISSAISQDNENKSLLHAQTVDPSEHSDSLRSQGFKMHNLCLLFSRVTNLKTTT